MLKVFISTWRCGREGNDEIWTLRSDSRQMDPTLIDPVRKGEKKKIKLMKSEEKWKLAKEHGSKTQCLWFPVYLVSLIQLEVNFTAR